MPKPLVRNPDGTPHQHVYIRRDKRSYKCADPGCSHWMPKKDLRGKASICAVCFQNPIILDWVQLQLARPHCIDCSNTKEAQKRKDFLKKFNELGIGVPLRTALANAQAQAEQQEEPPKL